MKQSLILLICNMSHPTDQPAGRLRLELFVHSVPAAIDFYTRILRFRVGRCDSSDSSPPVGMDADRALCRETAHGGYAHLTRGSITLGLSAEPPRAYPPALDTAPAAARREGRMPPCGTEIVLELPTLDHVHAEMAHVQQQGWLIEEGGLTLQSWGLWDFRVRDQDGYYWRITQESELARG